MIKANYCRHMNINNTTSSNFTHIKIILAIGHTAITKNKIDCNNFSQNNK